MKIVYPASFIAGIAGIAGLVFAQSPAAPAFDVADVHVSAVQNDMKMQGGVLRDGRYELRRATMLGLIQTAYGLDADKVLGGPSWLEWDKFDVAAKAPPTTSPATARLMLQALLADRFKLVAHADMKPMPAFVLSADKGEPKLKKADGSGEAGCNRAPPTVQPGVIPNIVLSCRNMTMEAFAAALGRTAKDYLPNPVVDATGLKGAWDFDLKWTSKALLQLPGADRVTVLDAVNKQLGLKLEAQTVPMPVLVVDSMSHQPTPNAANVAALLPARTVEFEVASVRPSLSDAAPAGALFAAQPGGRLDRRGLPMSLMLQEAWDLNPNEMVGLPKWVDSARYDIVAKAPASAIASGADLYTDDLRLMYRALLVDRFKMAAHYEDRPKDAYTLVAVKPKLTKADPANRTACTRQNAAGLSTRFVCQNISMAQFAERLSNIARQAVRYPVLDATGIEGSWDFTLTFSQIDQAALAAAIAAARPAGDAGAALDPIGGATIFDAVEKQLGLKLEKHQRPEPVFVLDHIEEKPTEN